MPKKSARRAPGMIFIEDKSTSLEVAARKKIIEETQRLKDDSYVSKDFEKKIKSSLASLTHSHSHSLTLSLSLTHTHTHSLTYSQHTHTHTSHTKTKTVRLLLSLWT